jgi:hypothetical protein
MVYLDGKSTLPHIVTSSQRDEAFEVSTAYLKYLVRTVES